MALLVVLIVLLHAHHRRRRDELRRGDWWYGTTDGSRLRRRFGELPGIPSGELVAGRYRGRPYLSFATVAGGAEHSVGYVVLALPLPAPCPPMLMQRRGWLSGGYRGDGRRGEVQSFDRAFQVFCPDGRFAHLVLSNDLRQRMLAHPSARLVTHRLGPHDLVVWHVGEFNANAVRWLVEYANGLLEEVLRAPWRPAG